MQNPLKAYMHSLSQILPRGEYGEKLEEIAATLGITKIRLYQASNPKETSHRLTPEQAMRLELLTGGLVPCESTNAQAGDILKAAQELIKFRGKK